MVDWSVVRGKERLLSALNMAGSRDVMAGAQAVVVGALMGCRCGRRRGEGAAMPGRGRSGGGTAAPPGCGGGCGRAAAGTAPVTNFAKPEISDRGRDAVRGAMFGRDAAHYGLVTERPGVW